MKTIESSYILAQIESRLYKHTYITKSNLPGYPDAIIFNYFSLNKVYPDRKIHPNLYHWYILIRQFASSTIQKWIDDHLYQSQDDTLPKRFIDFYQSLENKKTKKQVSPQSKTIFPLEKEERLNQSPIKETEYVIDIYLKQYSDKIMKKIEECLKSFIEGSQSIPPQILIFAEHRKIKIKCGQHSLRYLQLANSLQRSVEYHNLLIKKQKKEKNENQMNKSYLRRFDF